MDQPLMSLAETRSAMEAARGAFAALGSVVHEASGAELAELMTLADEVSAGAGAARVQVTVEAITRGEVAEAGVNVHTWVREHAPSLRQGGAAHVAKVATAVTKGGPTWNPEGVGPDPESPVGIIWDGVADGSVSPGLACATLAELERTVPLLVPGAVPTVTRALLELGVQWG
ncbi:MAG: HNH endonuclease, partial [Ornithinibacter sp.]